MSPPRTLWLASMPRSRIVSTVASDAASPASRTTSSIFRSALIATPEDSAASADSIIDRASPVAAHAAASASPCLPAGGSVDCDSALRVPPLQAASSNAAITQAHRAMLLTASTVPPVRNRREPQLWDSQGSASILVGTRWTARRPSRPAVGDDNRGAAGPLTPSKARRSAGRRTKGRSAGSGLTLARGPVQTTPEGPRWRCPRDRGSLCYA